MQYISSVPQFCVYEQITFKRFFKISIGPPAALHVRKVSRGTEYFCAETEVIGGHGGPALTSVRFKTCTKHVVYGAC